MIITKTMNDDDSMFRAIMMLMLISIAIIYSDYDFYDNGVKDDY